MNFASPSRRACALPQDSTRAAAAAEDGSRPATRAGSSSRRRPAASAAVSVALALCAAAATAADASRIEATVSGVSNAPGLVGCALFSSKVGFPIESKKHALKTVRVPAAGGVATCVFEQVAPGEYAIAVVHDTNGNGQADINFLGMPTEGIGVSNNVLPRMSAPTFEASRFTLAPGQTVRLAISLRY